MDTREIWLRTGIDRPWTKEKNEPGFWIWLDRMIEDGLYVSVAASETCVRVTLD